MNEPRKTRRRIDTCMVIHSQPGDSTKYQYICVYDAISQHFYFMRYIGSIRYPSCLSREEVEAIGYHTDTTCENMPERQRIKLNRIASAENVNKYTVLECARTAIEILDEATGLSAEPEGTARSRTTDPETSKTAANAMRGKPANELERKVLGILWQSEEGMTSEEVAEALDMTRVTVSPRFAPLKRKGLVYDSGERRKGLSGRPAIVWKCTDDGMVGHGSE